MRLNCYGRKITARRLKDGGLTFKCPWCKTPMTITSNYLAWSKKEVRTKEPMVCVLAECQFTFDIVHSCFVATEQAGEEFFYDGQPKESIWKVWRTRNEHRKRDLH